MARRVRTTAAELIKAPHLDLAALKVVLDEARRADFEVRPAVEEEALNFAATLSLEDRQHLAEAIAERNDRIRRRSP
ncbi:periplasmic heavy metal sensor [Rhizobium deserti]|uniref:periplasmic heavy metal sensor n=1 Tax=Rhizobium deserti TaxID=2547961 RepID=UPI0013868BE9